ncbi:MAG: tetratricopeptide repeat protein [Thermoanaerobaculia bacterium]
MDSAAVTAALGNAYLFKFKLTRDPQWADAAIRACERAVALDPDSADVRVTAGQVALLQGRFEEAASQFERALVARPNDPGAVLALAEALSRQQKFDAAEREYRRGVELQPSFWGAHNQLGAFYMARGRYEEAAARFREVRRLTPDNARGLSNLGAASMQMERWDEAIDAFEASLAIAPSASGFANLGTVYYFKGRYSDAAEAYEQAVALTPDRYVLWAFLGDALRWAPGRGGEAGRAFDRAIELAERELVLNPRDGEVRSTLAVCLAKRGRVSEALVQSSRALELLPDDLGVRKNAALVATLNGEETRAAATLTEIVAAGWDRNQITNDPEFAGLVNRGLLK